MSVNQTNMIHDLIIISAGKHGREVYGWASQAIAAGAPWRIKGFLDDRVDRLKGLNYPVGIISPVEEYRPQKDDRFVCAIGDPCVRRRYAEKVLGRGGKFVTLVHPTAVLGLNVTLGMGTIVGPLALIGADASIGSFVGVGPHSVCSHDNRIGDDCQLSGFCCLGGNVTVEEMCFFGMGTMVVPGVRIRKQAYVGAGSVVLKNVRAGVKVFGNPAVEIGTVEST
ncbi:MAG: acetyltransferase [Verrucomicrobiota bacterium]|jgi:sugar O-acyltransferase (sialic acid O-acetyltransferase NeuD family)